MNYLIQKDIIKEVEKIDWRKLYCMTFDWRKLNIDDELINFIEEIYYMLENNRNEDDIELYLNLKDDYIKLGNDLKEAKRKAYYKKTKKDLK